MVCTTPRTFTLIILIDPLGRQLVDASGVGHARVGDHDVEPSEGPDGVFDRPPDPLDYPSAASWPQAAAIS
jgi:hypothetical protein